MAAPMSPRRAPARTAAMPASRPRCDPRRDSRERRGCRASRTPHRRDLRRAEELDRHSPTVRDGRAPVQYPFDLGCRAKLARVSLAQLEYFVVVAEESNVGRAAA